MEEVSTKPAKVDDRIQLVNALRIVRPNLGSVTGVALYRLLRLVALEDILGKGAASISYMSGKKLGLALGLTKLEDFLKLCHDLKIGIIKVPTVTATKIHVDVYECVTCAGMEKVGRVLCHFEGGLIAGAVQSILKKDWRAVEVSCIGGLGDETCGFDLNSR